MPSENEHQKKYEDNKSLLENELDISKSTRYNWISTVAFYAVLHLVEARLATYGFHSANHTQRGNLVNTYRDFAQIRSKYKVLHTRSIVARYSGKDITKEKAQESLNYMKDIEEELEKTAS